MNGKITQALSDVSSGDITSYFIEVDKKTQKKNPPLVTVTYFSPCKDVENDAYGSGGTYQELTGRVTHVDPVLDKTITIDGQVIALEDIIKISEPV